MNYEVDDDFYDDFYDDIEKCCVKSSSHKNSYSINRSLQLINKNSQYKRGINCVAVSDNFDDKYYDNAENYNNFFGNNKTLSAIKKKRSLSMFERTESTFTPFTKRHKGVIEILENIQVQPKKVDEIINVLNNFMDKRMNDKPKVILLTGPPGCGKTTLMKKLFELFEFRVKCYDETQINSFGGDRKFEISTYFNLFTNFLYSSNYMPLGCYTSYGVKKVNLVFIQDLPNFIYDDPSIFSKKIVDIIKVNCNPIYVFKMTKSNVTLNNNCFWVFTPEVIKDLQIQHIQMSPVANTFMLAALKKYVDENKIITLANGCNFKGRIKCNRVWEEILSLANGDIRQGKIIIDFGTNVSDEVPGHKRRKSNASDGSNVIVNYQKTFDPDVLTIFDYGKRLKVDPFHLLGKMFYAKRLDNKEVNFKILASHKQIENILLPSLEKLKRPLPLKTSVSEIVAIKPVTTTYLIELILEHENHFANDIKSLKKIYENVLEIDSKLGVEQFQYQELDNYIYEIACRSLLYYNYKSERQKNTNSNSLYWITKPTSGYKSLNEIKNKIRNLHERTIDKMNDIICYRDLSDYLEYEDFAK